MSSFEQLTNLTVEDWNNKDMIVNNNLIILPTIKTKGNYRQLNFQIKFDAKLRVLVENGQVVNPTVNSYENNTSNLYRVGSETFNYSACTKYYLISENSEESDTEKFDFAVASAISNLNIAYEKDSYLGDGTNKGLISDVTPSSLIYITGDQLLQALLSAKNQFIADNNLMNSDRVAMMVAGQVYKDLNLPCFSGNKLVATALNEANIEVIFTPNYLTTTNRVDFVYFGGLLAFAGKEPSVLKSLRILASQDSYNDFAQLYVGYQSVGIYKRKSTAVQSYLKA